MSPKVLAVHFATALLLVVGPLDARQTNPTSDPATSPAPDGRILGIVVDEADDPVAGALVLLSDGRSTETDDDGRFSFVRVRPGTHEIAALTRSCAIAAGDFDVRSGRDALLQLILEEPNAAAERRERVRATPTRRMAQAALFELGDRSALDAVEQLAGHLFEPSGSRLILRARAGAATTAVVEPLLIMDGVKMEGQIAQALRGIRAADLASVEVYVGAVAGWHFQSGGAPAVIEITSRMVPALDPYENPEVCLKPQGR
jgi:hypothetical protein